MSSLPTLQAIRHSMMPSMPISAGLLQCLIAELETGGLVADLIREHPNRHEPLFALRVLVAVRFLQLTERAPALTRCESETVQRHVDDRYLSMLWQAVHEAVAAEPEIVQLVLAQPVQPHVPQCGAALLEGLAMLGARKVRLIELGACAGLNLIIDQYSWFGHDWRWGNASSIVRLWSPGRRPAEVEIVERSGCDANPRDVHDRDDRMLLRAAVPYESALGLADLDDALALAADNPPTVIKADDTAWLARELEHGPADADAVTVVWHSQFWGFLNSAKRRQIHDILTSAAARMPLARVAYDPWHWRTSVRPFVEIY